MAHFLFDPKLYGFGAAISYDANRTCSYTQEWLDAMEAEAKKAAQSTSGSGLGSGEAKAGPQ